MFPGEHHVKLWDGTKLIRFCIVQYRIILNAMRRLVISGFLPGPRREGGNQQMFIWDAPPRGPTSYPFLVYIPFSTKKGMPLSHTLFRTLHRCLLLFAVLCTPNHSLMAASCQFGLWWELVSIFHRHLDVFIDILKECHVDLFLLGTNAAMYAFIYQGRI